ncbi:histidine phosphatase family protein [Shewanella surugensis]|uniref:Histidine phosphatase family protein n=1 Tax=Shewanella surugensis TaxID=212020 RepID=A0ABT0LID6_9GAMM|nr:histidine phosphatase family protein [Shewanella surugensis]MCL1126891.1 histidine phosphatase family protein [Shewanella surugensis]
MKTHFFFLRHGECEGGRILRGRVDVPLLPVGIAQMQAVAQLTMQPDHIVSSPLRRCAEFAHQLHLTTDIDIHFCDALQEMDFGDWDGQGFDVLYERYEPALTRYWADPWSEKPPNGESMVMFEHRVDNAWEQLLQDFSGQVVLVIAHGGVIRHIMSRVLGLKRCAGIYSQFALGYGAMVKVEVQISCDEKLDKNGHKERVTRFSPRLHWPS